jgi:hypothetical protein
MTPGEAVMAARWTLKRDVSCPPEVVGALLAELDSRGVAIERVRELLNDESRHRIRMDGNWVKWSDIADALELP